MEPVMNDPQLLEAIERYLRGEMTPEEQMHFDTLRQTNPEVDQLVVEHKFFLEQLEQYGHTREFKNTLHDVHTSLSEKGEIKAGKAPSKIVYLWNRYKRVAAIAACIGGFAALLTSAAVWTISPKPPSKADIETLGQRLDNNETKTSQLEQSVKNVKEDHRLTQNKIGSLSPSHNIDYTIGGTGFLIDPKGLMVTNAHIVKNSRNIIVENARGQKFNAVVKKLDEARDVAIIKIDDPDFKPFNSLPYGIRKNPSDLAEEIFTLGFPRPEVVYTEGYLSAKTGYKGDTLSCQLSIAASYGNSGGPIFNENGEVIGILTSRETQTPGTVFAVQSKYIYQAIEEMKKNPVYKISSKLNGKSTIAGWSRVQQVKKLEDYVFKVKGDGK
jgi:serine protease Do